MLFCGSTGVGVGVGAGVAAEAIGESCGIAVVVGCGEGCKEGNTNCHPGNGFPNTAKSAYAPTTRRHSAALTPAVMRFCDENTCRKNVIIFPEVSRSPASSSAGVTASITPPLGCVGMDGCAFG